MKPTTYDGTTTSGTQPWQNMTTMGNVDTSITCALLFYPRPVLAFRYCHRLRLCVHILRVNFFVRAITHHTFQLES